MGTHRQEPEARQKDQINPEVPRLASAAPREMERLIQWSLINQYLAGKARDLRESPTSGPPSAMSPGPSHPSETMRSSPGPNLALFRQSDGTRHPLCASSCTSVAAEMPQIDLLFQNLTFNPVISLEIISLGAETEQPKQKLASKLTSAFKPIPQDPVLNQVIHYCFIPYLFMYVFLRSRTSFYVKSVFF